MVGRAFAARVAAAILATAVATPGHAQVQAAPEAVSVFDKIGEELITGMGAQASLIDDWKSRFSGGGAIAIWPLAEKDAPLPKPVLGAWNDTLTDSLLRLSKGRHKFVSRADLGAVIREAEHYEVVEGGNPIAAVLKGSKADFLVSGRARVVDNGVAVSYRVLEVKTGSPRAASREYVVPVDFARAASHVESLALDAAMADAASYFAKTIPDLQVLKNLGIRQADSGVETPLGRYLSQRASDAIVERASNALTERRVRVVDAKLDGAAIKGMKTRSVSGTLAADPGAYAFEGMYWQLDHAVELRLTAVNADGERYSWTKRIFKASVRPELVGAAQQAQWLKPPADGWAKSAGLGPIALDLSSNKGANPSYRVGENMVLLVRLGEESFLDCFYRQVDGKTMKIFPNRYSPSNRVQPRSQIEIPGGTMPFAFQVQEPEGVERVKCFAADRDLSKQLPPEIGAQDLAVLSAAAADRLSEIYRAVPKAKISEATMVVTVHK
jgi:hypothetical protein